MPCPLRILALDGRDLPATIGRPSDAYAWALINELRRDPAGFADRLDGLRTGAVSAAFGFPKGDPVVRDLKHLLTTSAYPGHYRAALARLRSAAAAGPFAWDDLLADRAAAHTAWIRTHSFEHTGQDSAGKHFVPGYNTGYRGGDPDAWGYPADAYAAWGENIGYTYGLTTNSKAGYRAGAFGLIGFQQRAAFIDTVSYVVEVNSPNLAHLEQLLALDGGALNAIGIDGSFFEAPGEARDGVGEATLSTHRLGLARQADGGGFLAGVVYRDGNGNGRYDAGEGTGATVTVAGPVNRTDVLDPIASAGVYTNPLPPGTYTVSAVAADGTPLGSRTVAVAGGNAWFEFAAPGATGPAGRADVEPVGAAGVRPTLAWAAVPGAVHYRVRLTDVTTNRGDLFQGAGGPGTTWSPPADLVPGRTYRVAVRASTPYHDAAWGVARDFTIPVPRVARPDGPVASLRPGLSWTATPGVTGYEIRVDDLTAGRADLFRGTRTTALAWAVPADLVSGRAYRVSVRAVNDQGRGRWSEAVVVRVATPRPVEGPPEFCWSAVIGAARYTVDVADLTTGRSAYRASVPGLTCVPPADLVFGHRYRWRVRAENSSGVGEWSAASDVSINP